MSGYQWKWEVTANEHKVPFGVMDISENQIAEMVTYSVNKLKTTEFKRVNFMVCKLDFNKADF